MAEKCIASIDNSSIMSIIGYNTEKNIINKDNHILIPYDNTPIISLNNSESDLNIITSINCCGIAGEVVEKCNKKTIKRKPNCCDHSDIYLETPAVDDQKLLEATATTTKHLHEKTAVIPKRLSDEFFSADDDEEEVISEIIIPKREGVLVLKDFSQNIVHLPSTSSLKNISSNYENEESNKTGIDCNDQIEDDDEDDDEDEVIRLGGIYDHNDVQSMDAIERIDYEEEQKLTGGVIVRNSSLICSANRLNIGLLNNLATNDDQSTNRSDEDNERSSQPNSIATTPTSSRSSAIRTTKTTVKLNLSKHDLIDETDVNNKIINTHGESSMNHLKHQPQFTDAFLMNSNSNSNDSLSSDKAYNIRVLNCDSVSCSTKYGTIINEPSSSKNSVYNLDCDDDNNDGDDDDDDDDNDEKCKTGKNSSAKKSLKEDSKIFIRVSDSVASTSSSSSPNGQFSECQPGEEEEEDDEEEEEEEEECCCDENAVDACDKDKSNINEEPESSSSYSNLVSDDIPIVVKSNQKSKIFDLGDYPATSSASVSRRLSQNNRNLDESILKQILPELIDNEFDEDTWADCEEGSDTDEICTCRNYAEEEERNASSEDELPSKDVDLSGYTNIGALSDDILQDSTNSESPRIHRKRKLTENRNLFGENMCCGETTPGGRKRIALENCALSPNLTPSSHLITSPSIFSNTSLLMERRTPRSIIPTKDNPPPELHDWLIQFQRWSHAERIVAVDRLIENCEPTQVRHMMKVIEPQFQRDFISLLPKELALQVLSYLEPMDLLRAAQTCRSWRFLCDDNLLWKEKCKEANIVMEQSNNKPKRGRAGNMPPISSPWKAAFMRQHIIEMNWRSRLIRGPKILKGHDDHVITCLQFCGNRIVSGSDDNTLKVWSAISGKCLRTLVGHTGGVWSSQMSGNTIISGSTDRTLKVWNADSGQCTHTLFGHTSTVRCMHLHANKVVSGSRDATLRVWDIETGICLHVLVGHLAAVRCVQYDGKFVVSGAYDYMVKVWNPERQECLHTLQGHTNRVYSLQFDGVHVVSGSLDTSIRVWDAESGTCKHTLMGHQSLTSGMELRSNILVSGNADSTVKVWDIVTGQCLQTLSGPSKHQSAVTCLQFNSRFVVTSSDDGTVKLWDVKTGEFIRNLVTLDSGGSGGVVWRIRSNDTKLVCAVGSRNGTEETKLMVLDFDVEGACLKCS